MTVADIIKNKNNEHNIEIKKERPKKSGKKQIELALAKQEEEIEDYQDAIYKLCLKHPLDFIKIINLQDEMELATRKANQMKLLINDLFSE